MTFHNEELKKLSQNIINRAIQKRVIGVGVNPLIQHIRASITRKPNVPKV